ncbi:MAG: TonB-dependent receptor, partial [Bacteroidota bacterium]
MIEKVEIITNPSARYEAEGTAGVLNIVLKEERRKGWNGTFDLGGGWPARHNATINLNHRRDKFNFFGSAGIRYRNTPRLSFEDREVWEGVRGDSTTEILRQEYLGYRGGISGNLRLGAEYQFGKYASLTGSFFYRKSDDFNTGNIDYLAYDYRETLLGVNIRDTEEAEDDESLDYNLNFERKFARKGQKFSANMVFTSGGETEAMDAVEQALDAQRQPKGLPDLQQQIRNSEWQWELTLMADYVHPFHKEGKFEAGYRSGIRNIDTEYRVEELDPELNIWETLPNLTNEFAYDEQIHAIYTSIGDKFDKFSYQVGLRGEYTRIQTLLRTTNEVNDRTFANLFPSAFLSYEFSAGNAIQLSYSRRTRRPRFWDLNPFFTFSNPISQRTGNPNLNPEFTHSIETSYLKYWDKATLSTSIYYRHTEGEITRITRVDSLGIGISRPENVATRDDIGAEFCLNVSPIKDWDITWSGNVFRGQINGANIGFARQTTFFSFT